MSSLSSQADTHAIVQSDPEGALWRDPPHYFEQIVYPAYVRANKRVFVDGDVENGAPSGFVERLLLVDAERMSIETVFDKACEAIAEVSR